MTAGRPQLIGGEMLAWSDARHIDRAPAGGPVLAHLAGLVVTGGRVLFAGPHDTGLVTALRDAGVAVTCLVRSLPDAQDLAGAGVQVLCGTLPKLVAESPFDAVIALDGLDRLCSPEGPQLSWPESLRALRRAARPGGALLLGVANELGVHRLVDPAPPTAARTDGDWIVLGDFDDSRPANPAGLAAALAAEGLRVRRLYAGWPVPQAPTVLATGAEATDAGGVLVAAVARAYADAYAARPVLSDPRRLATAAVRAGLGAELAACWIVLAHHATGPAEHATGPATGPAEPATGSGEPATDPTGPATDPTGPATGPTGPATGPTGPATGSGEPATGAAEPAPPGRGVPPPVLLPDPAGVQYLSRDAGHRLVRRVVTTATAPPGRGTAAGAPPLAGPLRREPTLLDGPAPAGRLFEEVLLIACLRHDLPAVRRLLGGYLHWLSTLSPAARPFATFDNVMLDGDRCTLLDPSWTVTGPVDPPVAAGRALRRFATTLIRGGYRHPWPSTTDVAALTATLAGAAGLALPDPVVADAINLDIEVIAATGGLPAQRRAALVDEVRAAPVAAAVTEPDSWRERQELLDRLQEQLTHAQSRCHWYDAQLARRDEELFRTRLLVSAFRGSPAFRLVRVGYAALRFTVRRARRLLRAR